MSKKPWLIVGIILLLGFVGTFFVLAVGPEINDTYAENQVTNCISDIEKNKKIEVVEDSKMIENSKETKKFVTILAFVVHTDIPREDLEKYIKAIPKFSNAVIISYSDEKAEELEFTGTPKELYDVKDRSSYYIVKTELKSLTTFDRRNKTE